MNRYTFSTQSGKAYYCNSIPGFIADRSTDIVGRLVKHAFDINKEQANAWENQITELQRRLEECGVEGDIIFEYDIVRLGKRIDVILLIRHMVFSLEFKNGKNIFTAQDAQQAEDYAIVDAINEAIDNKRKISFRYTDFNVFKQRYISNDGKPYTVSPYTLIWDGDCYYMRGFCDERQEMRNFRLDRIAEQPKILNQIAVMPPEDYNPADYSKHVFQMYDTDEPISVQLHCHVSVMKYLIDNFGVDFKVEPIDDEHFNATVSACISTTFYR